MTVGFEGFKSVMENCLTNARTLSKALEASERFICLSSIHRQKGVNNLEAMKTAVSGLDSTSSAYYDAGLPVVAFRFSDKFKADFPKIKQASVSTLLRARNWIVPSLLPMLHYALLNHELNVESRLPTATR